MSFLREKVIFDTNKIRNPEPNNFLGGKDELKKFASVSDIVLPDIVLDEIRYQKKRSLKSNRDKFLTNPFYLLLGLEKEATKKFDSDSYLQTLEEEEEITYSKIELQDYSILKEMRDLAIRKLPPFEKGENTDKGFKDAYIYFTILEYLDVIPDEYIFVCTDDGRLKEALSKHSRIRIVNNFEDFSQESISSFYDDYFIEKLNQEFGPFQDITKDDLKDFWFSINENHVLLINVADQLYVVEIESGEIIEYKLENGYRDLISNFISSPNWGNTHAVAKTLKEYVKYLSTADAIGLVEALFDNDQISGTFHYDVRSFYWELFDLAKDALPDKLRKKMSDILEKTKYQDNEFEI